MSRRPGRGRRRSYALSQPLPDPFRMFGANYAWRAEDSINNGANTTTLVPYIGSVAPVRDSTGQGIKAASANFGGRTVVPFSGAGSGYTASLAATADMTVAHVVRLTLNASGMHAMTAAGALNSGNSSYLDANNLSAQKLAAHADRVFAFPAKAVVVCTYGAAGATGYLNSYTAVSVAQAGALAGDALTIGAITPSGTYTMNGEWRTSAVWTRALSVAEVTAVLQILGSREGITIAP